MKNFHQAIIYYGRALTNAEQCGENLSPLYVSLYSTYRDLKDYPKAIEYMQKELELNETNSMESFKTIIEMIDVHRESIDKSNSLSDDKFWQIDELLDKAQTEATKLNDTKLLKDVFLRKIELREFYKKHTLAEIIKDEAKMMGIDMEVNSEEMVGTDCLVDQDSEPQNVPQIGDDILLDDLSSDSSDNNDNDNQNDEENDDTNATSPTKKRRSVRSAYKMKNNEKGETPLHRHCIDGNYEQCERLIRLGHPINVHDHAGWLPLHEACNHGHVEIVKLLLKHKAAINDRKNQDKISPLHDSCANGQLGVIEVLLEAGADVTLLNNNGQTAFELLQKLWRKSQNDVTETDRFMYEQIHQQFTQKLNQNVVTNSQLNVCDDNSNSVDYADQFDNIIDNTIDQSEAGPSNIQIINRNHDHLLYDNDSNSNDSYDYNRKSPESSSINYNYNSSDEILAVNEYQSVMNQIGSKKNVNVKISPQKRSVQQVKRSAFLNENEVGENWLENDLQPNAKRQKFQSPREESHKSLSPIKRTDKIETAREKPVQIDSDDGESADDEQNICTRYVDAFDVLMESSNSSDGYPQRKSKPSTTRRNSLHKNHQRNTLLNSGFVPTTRDRLSSENDVSSTSSLLLPPDHVSPQKQISSKMSLIKVRIEGHTLCVPIVNDTIDNLNVGWLADEAARRYYK